MKAVYKETEGAYTARLTERPIPALTEQDNVLIRVRACTTCGLDMHIWQGKLRDCRPPIIMGHEFVGTIVETVGESLGFSVGERVICQPHLYACGHCEACRLGYPQFCRGRRSLGIQRDGALAEYVAVPARYLHRVPDNLPDEFSCLAEPFTISVSDVLVHADLTPGESVLIIGAGQVAQLALVAARCGGASRVFLSGVEADASLRLPAAAALGADLVINSSRGDPVEAILRATHGRGVDLVVEASGSPAGIAAGIKALRPGGRMAVLGATKQPSVLIPWDAALRKAVTLQFNMMSDYTHMERALALLAAFPGDLSPLITHRRPLAEWEQCFTELRDQQGIKGLITIG